MKSRDAITSKNIHLWVTYNRLSWVKTRDAIASKILFSKNIVKMVDLVSVFHGFPVALTEESSFILETSAEASSETLSEASSETSSEVLMELVLVLVLMLLVLVFMFLVLKVILIIWYEIKNQSFKHVNIRKSIIINFATCKH